MPMLHAALLRLKSLDEVAISPTQGHHAYALFLNLINQSNKHIATELHESASAKPFTISPLQGKFQRADKNLKTITGSDYSIRLTFLQENLFAYFMDATLKAAEKPLRLESATFKLEQVVLDHDDSPLCNHQSYEELLSKPLPQKQIGLQFISPTVFRSGGKRNVLYPDSTLVFSSFLNKWQQFSPVAMDESAARYYSKMIIARYKLATRILHFNSYQEVGFEGSCTYELPSDIDENSAKAINTLADFAFYCGTGAKTTMGMGQTRRIK